MPHDGNRSSSDDEVKAVAELVDRLLGAKWVDQDGKTCPLTAADFRVVAPYNAQVNRLATRLAARRPGRDCGQVPRANLCGGHLLNGHLVSGGCATGDGISLLSQPPQRRHFARTLCDFHCRKPRTS